MQAEADGVDANPEGLAAGEPGCLYALGRDPAACPCPAVSPSPGAGMLCGLLTRALPMEAL